MHITPSPDCCSLFTAQKHHGELLQRFAQQLSSLAGALPLSRVLQCDPQRRVIANLHNNSARQTTGTQLEELSDRCLLLVDLKDPTRLKWKNSDCSLHLPTSVAIVFSHAHTITALTDIHHPPVSSQAQVIAS